MGYRDPATGNIIVHKANCDELDRLAAQFGKNIVKVLLENYGYTVIDLGRDVDPAAVVEAARKYEAPLVGLSALMTTTLKSMAQTIAQLHDAGLPCKIMVGGAVLTPEYAKEISADFYARDAKESVDIAKRVVG